MERPLEPLALPMAFLIPLAAFGLRGVCGMAASSRARA